MFKSQRISRHSGHIEFIVFGFVLFCIALLVFLVGESDEDRERYKVKMKQLQDSYCQMDIGAVFVAQVPFGSQFYEHTVKRIQGGVVDLEDNSYDVKFLCDENILKSEKNNVPIK